MKGGHVSRKQHITLTVFLSTVVTLVLGPLKVYAGEFAVVSVVRNFPMKSDDEIAKDYYINAGTNNGLKEGAFLEALRKVSIHDNVNAKVVGDTAVPIARLKIIHVDKSMGIARVIKFFERKLTPNAGFDDVMVGDLIKVSQKQ